MPLIEDAAGVENFEEIAGVDGIDMVKVGSLDLALSMGLNSGRPDGGNESSGCHRGQRESAQNLS